MEVCSENVDAQRKDLISELPDALLHQIFSFLDMRFVVQTSILGKRWRYLWTSLPFLNFNEEEYNRSMVAVGEGEQKPDYKNFTDFLDRIFCVRNGSNLSIQTFSLCCDGDYIREHAFASVANFGRGRSQEISKLRSLDLSKCFYTKLNHFVGLPCLKILHLKSVFLEGGESTDNFFPSCPVLETLVIFYCVVMQTDELNISAPCLKNLELGKLATNMFQFRMFQDACYLKVTVSAPNLTSFKCADLVSVEYSLVNVSSVVEADIDVEFPSRNFLSGTMEEDAKNVIECLAGLCNVRSLRLSAWLLEAVYKVYKTRMEGLVTPFCNLRLLKLKTSLSTSEYRALTYLFDTCPNVETLVLEMTKPPERPTTLIHNGMYLGSSEEGKSMETKKSLEAYLSSECNISFHHLKFVEIRNAIGNLNLLEFLNFSGSLNELEFLKFLLKNAAILETITVYFSKTGLLDHKMRRRFSEELVTFSGSISAGVGHINYLVLVFMCWKHFEVVLGRRLIAVAIDFCWR